MKKVEVLVQPRLSDLNAKSCREVARVLNQVIADIFALFVKTKSFHWHMSGYHYRDYHLLLDEHSDQIFGMIDVLAERVRKLGERTIQSIGQIQTLKHLQDTDDVLAASDMLSVLLQDNKALLRYLRAAHEVASDARDVATTSVLESYIDETERRAWFLFEMLSKDK